MIDVGEHPDSSIGEISARTGLPQSHVSQSVARLRARGALETTSDPRDGRRTLVRMAPEIADRAARVGSVEVDAALGDAMDISDPDALAEIVAALQSVLARLRDAETATAPATETRSPWPLGRSNDRHPRPLGSVGLVIAVRRFDWTPTAAA